MDNKNRKIILSISFLRKFISVFFTLFFNIYIFKTINDFGLIIKYNLVGVISDFIFTYIIMRTISNKNAKMIYNSSFIELIICIFLLIILKESIVKCIYLFRILYSLAQVSYHAPKELVIMSSNTHNTMSNFLANTFIMESFATIITPVFSGFIISSFSYNMLFVLLSFEALIIIIIASQLKSFYISDRKLNVREFWHKSKDYPHLKDIYNSMFYRRISLKGVISDLLPVILFVRVGTELTVGAYDSLFAVLTIICLFLLKRLNKIGYKKRFYTSFAIVIFISSTFVVFNSSFTTLIIYYILINSLGTVIESESCSLIYDSINVDDLNIYKREHEVIFCAYMLVGQVISYGLTYILYTFLYNVNILSVSICITMFFLIIACIYLQKTEKYMEIIR